MFCDLVKQEIIQAYTSGEDLIKVRGLVSPPLSIAVLYKILELENIPLRGRISRRKTVSEDTQLLCSNCTNYKPARSFSKHKSTILGYDTSRCKDCKKSFNDWKNVPIERRIFNRAKARAKERQMEFNIEITDIVLPSECPVLHKPFIYGNHDWTYSLDRIDPKLGYIKGNIQIISNRANVLKNDATLQEIEKLFLWMKTLEKEPSVPFWQQTW